MIEPAQGKARLLVVAVHVLGDAGLAIRDHLQHEPLLPKCRIRLAEQILSDGAPVDVTVVAASLIERTPYLLDHTNQLRFSGHRVVVLYDDRDEAALLVALQCWKGSAFVPATRPVQEVAAAIALVADGGMLLPAELWPAARTWAGALNPALEAAKVRALLTTREQEALRLLAHGRSNAEIAKDMTVSVAAARFHVSNLLTKLGCHTRGELIALAHRSGVARRWTT